MSTHPNGQHDQPFPGFQSPNFTQVPDELFDVLMPSLSDRELRVLLYIIRRTFGFKRDSDSISLKQMVEGITTKDGRVLDRGTGMSKATVARGLESLRERGIIVAVRNRSAARGDEATTYRLRFKDHIVDTPCLSSETRGRVSAARHPVSQQRDTQETGRQKTVKPFEIRKADTEQIDITETTLGHGDDRSQQTAPAPTPPETEPSAGFQRLREQVAALKQARVSQPQGTGRRRRAPVDEPAPPGVIPPASALVPASQTTSSSAGEGAGWSGAAAAREGTSPVPTPVGTAPRTGPTRIGELLGQRVAAPPSPRRGPPPGSRDDRDHVAAYLKDFARELADQAPLSATITRALRCFQQAGIAPELWGSYLYEARAITQEHSGQIKAKPQGERFQPKPKMGYYFAVLEDLLGLKPRPDTPHIPDRTASRNVDTSSPIAGRSDPAPRPHRFGYSS